jgi:hypothetical protein
MNTIIFATELLPDTQHVLRDKFDASILLKKEYSNL